MGMDTNSFTYFGQTVLVLLIEISSYVNFGIIDYDSEIAPHLHAKDSNHKWSI